MKRTLLLVALITAVALLSSLREDIAEAIFKAWLYSTIATFFAVCAWIAAKVRLYKIQRIRREMQWKRQIRAMQVKGRKVEKELLTEFDYNVATN
jgi:hypothetical protein